VTLVIVVFSLAALGLTGASALVAARSNRSALFVGTIGTVLACAAGLAASLTGLIRGQQESLRATWPLPVGELHVGLDPLSSFFLACVFLVSGLAAVYGGGYLRAVAGNRRVAPVLFFFCVLVASMAALVIARDGILFILAWEVMSVASFFLVTFQNEREDVRRAIDVHEGDTIDKAALKDLIRAAIALNLKTSTKPKPRRAATKRAG
jgi:formate hydrogenlyase subunit 3/multisubunit Na+/H+ antiporter MnhD subunit